MKHAYYNEIDPKAAAWLRELIKAGLIMDGEVDERNILDVKPEDTSGFLRCHFFAGIGVWDYALQLAGWPEDRPMWSLSCPCQSFSSAGKGAGFDDERHLWPFAFWLVSQCRPDTIFGEQVEASIRHGWLDLVSSDLEAAGYAVGAVVLPAASVGAPHIRSRLWFVACAGREYDQRKFHRPTGADSAKWGAETVLAQRCGGDSGMADIESSRCKQFQQFGKIEHQEDGEWKGDAGGICSGQHCRMGIPDSARREPGRNTTEAAGHGHPPIATSGVDGPGPVNGFWRDAEWIPCRDEKFRPIKSGVAPMVTRIANRVVRGGDRGVLGFADNTDEARVMRLKGYGNSIVAPLAAEFIKAAMECES